MKNRKLKLLAFCDTPVCYSGFAQVSRNILAKIHEMGIFDITVWGINHVFEIDEYGRFIKPDVPYEILPAAYISAEDERKGYSSNDVFGREKLARYMFQNDFDVFWSVQDPYVIEDLIDKIINLKTRYNKNFKSIFYFPVDAYNIDHKWAEIPKYFDHPVVYTEFGKERVLERCPELKDRLKVIYHGTNTKDFYPVDKEKRNMIRESLGIPEDTCVVLNVNRNQPRKDLSRTLEVFSEFKKKVPNSKLFLFCRNQDVGGNILERAKYYGLTSKDIIFPKLPTGKDEFKGASIEEVNQSYNASDICISTTLGEGWGLSCLLPDMPVKTSKGYKKIVDIKEGELVLTREGYKNVYKTSNKYHKDKVYNITVQGRPNSEPLSVTGDHKILTMDGWKEAKDLQPVDLLFSVEDKFNEYSRHTFDLAELDIENHYCRTEKNIWEYGSKKKDFKRYIHLNKDFAELYGIYLAEGSASKNGIVFSISQEEKEFTERIIYLVKKVWGLECAVENDKNSKKRWIRVYGNILKRFYAKYCGTGARSKDVYIIDMLTSHTAAKVLKGFWEGDGSKESCGYEMTTCSKDLAYSLSSIGDKLGIKFTLEHSVKRDAYRLRTNKKYAYAFSMILGNQCFEKFGFNKDGQTWMKIKSITTSNYEGFVYDLSVEDCPEFMTHQCLVHNCTESMATKLPVVFPDNTSLTEIIGKNEARGFLAASGKGRSDHIQLPPANDPPRPLTDIDDMVEKMVFVWENKGRPEVLDKVNKAYEWVQDNTWDKIFERDWKPIFEKVVSDLKNNS